MAIFQKDVVVMRRMAISAEMMDITILTMISESRTHIFRLSMYIDRGSHRNAIVKKWTVEATGNMFNIDFKNDFQRQYISIDASIPRKIEICSNLIETWTYLMIKVDHLTLLYGRSRVFCITLKSSCFFHHR